MALRAAWALMLVLVLAFIVTMEQGRGKGPNPFAPSRHQMSAITVR